MLRSNTRFRVWRTHHERFAPWCTKGTVKHDKKINVWGCFTAHGVGKIYRVPGIMDKQGYHNILVHQLKPSLLQLFPDGGYMFQQDNDPKHTSHLCKDYIDAHFPRLEHWPSQSPDLNPIENLWSILDQRLKERDCNTEEQLYQIIKEGWEALEPDLLTKLADSMPRRCQAVIDNKGYATKY